MDPAKVITVTAVTVIVYAVALMSLDRIKGDGFLHAFLNLTRWNYFKDFDNYCLRAACVTKFNLDI